MAEKKSVSERYQQHVASAERSAQEAAALVPLQLRALSRLQAAVEAAARQLPNISFNVTWLNEEKRFLSVRISPHATYQIRTDARGERYLTDPESSRTQSYSELLEEIEERLIAYAAADGVADMAAHRAKEAAEAKRQFNKLIYYGVLMLIALTVVTCVASRLT